MPPYRIVLAENHISPRQAIKKIVEKNPGLTVMGQAGDGLKLLELLERSSPDMVTPIFPCPGSVGWQQQ